MQSFLHPSPPLPLLPATACFVLRGPCRSFNGFISLSLIFLTPPYPTPPPCVPSSGAKLSAQAPLSLSRNAAGDAPHFRRVTRTCACGAGSDALPHLWFSHLDFSLCFCSWLVIHVISVIKASWWWWCWWCSATSLCVCMCVGGDFMFFCGLHKCIFLYLYRGHLSNQPLGLNYWVEHRLIFEPMDQTAFSQWEVETQSVYYQTHLSNSVFPLNDPSIGFLIIQFQSKMFQPSDAAISISEDISTWKLSSWLTLAHLQKCFYECVLSLIN